MLQKSITLKKTIMKKHLLTFLLASSTLIAFSQEKTESTKVYRNEFGIDATNFIKQFFDFNNSQPTYFYSPSYYLTYRRHLKKGNIRFAIGGMFSHQNRIPGNDQDSNKYEYNASAIDFRIGWESSSELSKHWQVYYGIDFRPSFGHSKDDAQYWGGGYANGIEQKSEVYRIAPLLGFRLKLNNRLSLSTEASFSINWVNTSSRQFFTPTGSQYAPKPDVKIPNNKVMNSSFYEPLAIIITFDI